MIGATSPLAAAYAAFPRGGASVAVIAFQAGTAVIPRFAARDATVVAATTAARKYLAVIHDDAAPSIGIMASPA